MRQQYCLSMIYKTLPENFKSKFEVVSCFIEFENEILFLERLPHKPEGNKLGLPAGKINKEENSLEALIREVREETGIDIQEDKLFSNGKLYVRYPEYDFVYYNFRYVTKEKPKVKIKHDEHEGYQWLIPKEALRKELVRGEKECLEMFYGV